MSHDTTIGFFKIALYPTQSTNHCSATHSQSIYTSALPSQFRLMKVWMGIGGCIHIYKIQNNGVEIIGRRFLLFLRQEKGNEGKYLE